MTPADRFRALKAEQAAKKNCDNPVEFNRKYFDGHIEMSWYKPAQAAIDRSRFVLILALPGSGKTYRFTVEETTRRIAKDRTHRVGIFSKAKSKAENYMRGVAGNLKYNKKLIKDFGAFLDKDTVANTEKIMILGAPDNVTTPSITNLGIAGQAESLRFHTIIMDDPIDLETALSETEVDKFIDRMKNTFIPRLEPGGQFIVIGSRFHQKDGYHWLLTNPLFKDGIFILPALNEQGESSIPERFTTEQLNQLRSGLSIGPEGTPIDSENEWQARYQQKPMPRGQNAWDTAWLKNKKTSELPVVIRASIDPAYSTEKKADYTAMIAGGYAANNKDIILTKLAQLKISAGHPQRIRDFAKDTNSTSTFIEVNNAKTLGNECRAIGVVCTDVNATGEKKWRIGALEMWWRREPGQGCILFHQSVIGTEGYERFLGEYGWFPNGEHEHLLDAIKQLVDNLKGNAGVGGWI